MKFDFNEDKNELLFKVRGISFYQVIESIAEKGVLLNIEHPNKEKYPNQYMFVIDIDNYTYSVPYVIDDDIYFLKTIFPNRTYLYLLEEESNEDQKK
jgi:hypothetical protein